MNFDILTLQPTIFDSFLDTSLIARAISKQVISVNRVDWRSQYGVGNHHQADDTPYGGGHGMVLQAEPVFEALTNLNAISPLHQEPTVITTHATLLPNNSLFERYAKATLSQDLPIRNITIHLTPRGFPLTQPIVEWLATSTSNITIVCGRYEGFDARVNQMVDLEISLGDYILNGGEVGAMVLIESISRLLPGFLEKTNTAKHDSFSTHLNIYDESREQIIGKHRIAQSGRVVKEFYATQLATNTKLFDDHWWEDNQLPRLEHPHYTKPAIWHNWKVPDVLLNGDHKKIDLWRKNWHTIQPD